MATTPVKSQPLHNFSMPKLKWAQSNSRLRRRNSPDPHHLLSSTAAAQPAPSSSAPTAKPFSFSSLQQEDSSAEVFNKKKDDAVDAIDDDGEGNEPKPWKLRPRKTVNFPATSFKKDENLLEKTAAVPCGGGGGGGSYGPQKSTKLRRSVGEAGGQNHGSERQRKMTEEKSRLWISLSREEIEEDVFALTGSRPARRPKKRAKLVQKHLDKVFPGLYLVGMTVDYYRILLSKVARAEL